jgi:uncharacterized membrane protein (UPF0136 family)
MNHLYKLIATFIFGGMFFVSIYYAANILQNTALSAIICLLPISIMSCYVMINRKIVMNHSRNLIPVLLLTLVSILVLISLIKWTELPLHVIVTLVLILWIILQYSRAIYLPVTIDY